MTRVTLNGLTATYRPAEMEFMRRLWKSSPREAEFIHEAKALFKGRLR